MRTHLTLIEASEIWDYEIGSLLETEACPGDVLSVYRTAFDFASPYTATLNEIPDKKSPVEKISYQGTPRYSNQESQPGKNLFPPSKISETRKVMVVPWGGKKSPFLETLITYYSY